MPEYRQFHSAARSMAVSRLVSPSGDKTKKNCEDDGDRQLVSLAELSTIHNDNIVPDQTTARATTSHDNTVDDIINEVLCSGSESHQDNTIDDVINEVLYGSETADPEPVLVPVITMADKEVIAYVAGSAIRSVLQKVKCDMCKSASTSTEMTSTFILLKQFTWMQDPTGGLLQPTGTVIV
jgi:hypothetical protein